MSAVWGSICSMTDGDSGQGTAALPTTTALTPTTPLEMSTESAAPIRLTPLQAAADAAHWRGLHAAYADIHCPACIKQGYVGSGYDRERVATGSAQ